MNPSFSHELTKFSLSNYLPYTNNELTSRSSPLSPLKIYLLPPLFVGQKELQMVLIANEQKLRLRVYTNL